MPAQINYVQTDAEARARLQDDDAHAADTVTAAMRRTLDQLAAELPGSSTLHVARDHEDCYFALVEDLSGSYPLGETFALGEQGQIGHGGVNQPVYHDTLADLLNADAASTFDKPPPIPLARVADSGALVCPRCAQEIAPSDSESTGDQTSRYARHYEEAHGPYRWDADLPAELDKALQAAGVASTSAKRAYREARHQRLPHQHALTAAITAARAETQASEGGD